MSRPSEVSAQSSRQTKPNYNREERTLLLQIAREAILSFLQKREMPPFILPAPLLEPRGVFTTIYLKEKLRGCVGYPAAILPLHRAVAETARASALEDPRFYPLRLDEAEHLRISISVLSPLQPISADQVEIGRHGLVISQAGRRGLLLPQVPVEHGWDRVTFLEQTCLKAGLSPDAWKSGTHIEAFTAETFADDQGK
ncbi:MAG TPA: AmmeMemoRadiSam system protein A [Terriglobales bacterium]|nr:AmmeMemoRadiSam system protein A [Terriglobales bacterium]